MGLLDGLWKTNEGDGMNITGTLDNNTYTTTNCTVTANTITTGTITTTTATPTIATPLATSYSYHTIPEGYYSWDKTKEKLIKCPIFKGCTKIEFEIKNIRVLPNEEDPHVVIVEFNGGHVEKAVTAKGDKFDLETGISICLMKAMIFTLISTDNATREYNRIIKKALKQYEDIKKEKVKEEERKIIKERQKAKRIAKKKARDERRRKQTINDQKEAYVQAMLELKSMSGDDGR